MGFLKNFLGHSPFPQLHEHTKKVHECVELIRPLTEALLSEDFDTIRKLHDQMARTEHEADVLKTDLRSEMGSLYFLSVGKADISKFLTYQDSVADAAEDYAVVLMLRRTKLPGEIKEEFREFVEQVVGVSEQLLALADKLSSLAERAFTGEEVKEVSERIDRIGEEEWKADRMCRRFSHHFYQLEGKMDPITIFFLDKYCNRLSAVANSAEKTAKYLRLVIHHR